MIDLKPTTGKATLAEFKTRFNATLTAAWSNSIPTVQFLTEPMPDAIQLPLTGSGVAATTSIEDFESQLLKDCQGKSGSYYAYVQGFYNSEDDADTYELVGWEVLTGSRCAGNTVVLYYKPISESETVKKHMPGLWQEYDQGGWGQ